MASLAAWLVPCIIIFLAVTIIAFCLVKRAQNNDILSSFRNRNPFARTATLCPKPEDSLPSSAPAMVYVPPPYSVVVEKPPAAGLEAVAVPATNDHATSGNQGQPSPAIQRILNMK